jgi:hypothetical protein
VQMGDSAVTDMTAPVGKIEPSRDGSTSSIASSPEPEAVGTYTQENPQQQKRKGGRKPVSPHRCHVKQLHNHNVKDRTNQAS